MPLGDQTRRRGLDGNDGVDVPPPEQRDVRDGRSKDEFEILAQIELVERGRHARVAIGVARGQLRRDTLAPQIARFVIGAVGANHP